MPRDTTSPHDRVVASARWPRRVALSACGASLVGLGLNVVQLVSHDPFAVTLFFVIGLPAYALGVTGLLVCAGSELRRREVL